MQKEYLYVAISGILSGVIVFGGAVFVSMGLTLFEMSVVPQALGLVFLLMLIIWKKNYRIKKEYLGPWLIYGLFAGFATLTQYAPLIFKVPVAVTVLLLYTQPLWTILYSWSIRKEQVTKRQMVACLLVILGVLFLTPPSAFDDLDNGIGMVIGILGGIALSGWIIAGRNASIAKAPPLLSKTAESLLQIVIIILLMPLISLAVDNPQITGLSLHFSPSIWIFLSLFALFFLVINHLLFLKGVQVVSAADAGILLLLEPLSAAILAMIFLNQPLTPLVVMGGVLIIGANILLTYNASSHAKLNG